MPLSHFDLDVFPAGEQHQKGSCEPQQLPKQAPCCSAAEGARQLPTTTSFNSGHVQLKARSAPQPLPCSCPVECLQHLQLLAQRGGHIKSAPHHVAQHELQEAKRRTWCRAQPLTAQLQPKCMEIALFVALPLMLPTPRTSRSRVALLNAAISSYHALFFTCIASYGNVRNLQQPGWCILCMWQLP